MTGVVLERIVMDCPVCDEIHEVELRQRATTIIIKGEEVAYTEKYFYCENADEDECEFENGRMVNENLLAARNEYRKMHGLLTSMEIVNIREMYGVSQVELAKMLGWGEATVSRYESKAIQDEAYDNILRMIKDNPLVALNYLDKNKDKFSAMKYAEIRNNIAKVLDSYGKEYLSRQSLESEYIFYAEKNDANGNANLSIDKLEIIISYLAAQMENLYKVKLMKLLWYIDALSFKRRGIAITGLVYNHQKFGALPVGHNKIVNLENVLVDEIDDPKYDLIYRFLKNDNVSMDCISDDELEIVDEVVDKFRAYTGAEIRDYMHQEIAYTHTKMNEIIPFSLAKEIREFN